MLGDVGITGSKTFLFVRECNLTWIASFHLGQISLRWHSFINGAWFDIIGLNKLMRNEMRDYIINYDGVSIPRLMYTSVIFIELYILRNRF